MQRNLHFTRTRLAPTPSGFLHLGNALSFLITSNLATRTGAKLLLRIDDMDQERVEAAYVEDVFETLRFLGIEWEEGPVDAQELEARYSQRYRSGLYAAALRSLRESGSVFACTCSRKQVLQNHQEGVYTGVCRDKRLPLDTPGASWRLRTDAVKSWQIKTLDGTTEHHTLPPSMTDFIVRKKDGDPSYQLCSLVDDLHFGVDLVVRGQDLFPSTIAQLCLAHILGEPAFGQTTFYHHPLVEGTPGLKLSKSAGDTSIMALRAGGKSREAVQAMIRALALPMGIAPDLLQ